MDAKRVKDLMVPLGEYAVVSENATLLEAVHALEHAQKNLPTGRQPYRAVLVSDENGRIVGKVGQLTLLRALEPRYDVIENLESLSKAGVSEEFVSLMMEHYRFFQEDLVDLCSRAGGRLVRGLMQPVAQSIDENASLPEAIHSVVVGQTLSILVTRGSEVVGLLRLSELFDEVTAQMKTSTR